jgi:hypothetical protein
MFTLAKIPKKIAGLSQRITNELQSINWFWKNLQLYVIMKSEVGKYEIVKTDFVGAKVKMEIPYSITIFHSPWKSPYRDFR